MKFCKYCGAQLEDNAVCNCEKSRAAQAQAQQANAQAQPQYQQPVQPQQSQYQNPVQQQYAQPQNPQTQQSPYAVNNTAPIGENAFVKALKNIPVVFTSFFKDSKTVIKTAKAEKDIILGALFSAIFFIALILGNMFLMLSMSALDFPKTLLVSLVTAVLIGGFYSVILFAYVKKYKTAPPRSFDATSKPKKSQPKHLLIHSSHFQLNLFRHQSVGFWQVFAH